MGYILSIIFYIAAIFSAGDFYKMICLFGIGSVCLIAGSIEELSLTFKKIFVEETEKQEK